MADRFKIQQPHLSASLSLLSFSVGPSLANVSFRLACVCPQAFYSVCVCVCDGFVPLTTTYTLYAFTLVRHYILL